MQWDAGFRFIEAHNKSHEIAEKFIVIPQQIATFRFSLKPDYLHT